MPALPELRRFDGCWPVFVGQAKVRRNAPLGRWPMVATIGVLTLEGHYHCAIIG